MSGSTIGGVVGGAIGFVVSGFNPAGAQWGWMIGSAVGGIVDPERIEGPRLGEARTQTSTDGVPLIYGYGDFPCAGNVTWVDEVKEHRNVESSKGGPEQVTYTYTISYMVVVCKGEISGFKLVRRNGKIVYDARTDAELAALGYSSQDIAETRAAQANFLQKATLYYGTQTQMPDPTMVAVKGAGNVPAYTCVAYIVMKDDETQQGEYAQFEFVVANCGERTEDFTSPALLLVTGDTMSGPVMAMADATATPTFTGIDPDTGADVPLAVPAASNGILHAIGAAGSRYSSDRGQTWLTGSAPFPRPPRSLEGGPDGWALIDSLYGGGDTPARSYTHLPTDYVGGDIVGTGSINFVKFTGGYWWTDVQGALFRADSLSQSPWESVAGVYQYDISRYVDIESHNGSLYAVVYIGLGPNDIQIRRSDDEGETWPTLVLSKLAAGVGNEASPYKLQSNGNILVAITQNSVYAWSSADAFAEPHLTGLANLNQAVVGRTLRATADRFYFLGRNPATLSQAALAVSEDGISFGPIISIPLVGATGMALLDGADSGLTPIPDSPGFYIDSRTGDIVGPPGTQIDPCQPTLGEIVADQCERRGVTSRDVSELTDTVGGYRVAKPSSPQVNIQGLQPGYFFGASEFDGTLHFPKRGRPITFSLTHDDFLERDGDPIKWERTQERDFLRKVTVGYADPETAWAPTTQQAERRAATITAEGESTMELPITGDKDWAAQTAHKSIKVAWGEPDECTFHVTIDYADLVTGAEGMVPYTDGNPTQVRIDRIEDEGLIRMVTARITRPDLYESNASGASKPLPQFPGSNIRGPTDGLLMNIPILIDQDDRPGIHWAAWGMMSGWQGGTLQIRRAGQWVTVDTVSQSAGMGWLTSPLPAHSGDIDTQNVLSVRMNEDVESVTWVNLLQERNPIAILRPDGTAEIIQFQTATQTAPDEYDLTKLLRNRLDTGSSDHAAGARVVVLDSRIQYATLESTDLGQTLQYRFVSVGTDPDEAPIQTITLATMESQREWPVYMLEAVQDGDDYILTWLARDRLGNDVFPIRSQNWAGYEVSYSWSGGSGSIVVTSETHTFTLPGASDVTFSVAQLNQYTGAGPAETVTVP